MSTRARWREEAREGHGVDVRVLGVHNGQLLGGRLLDDLAETRELLRLRWDDVESERGRVGEHEEPAAIGDVDDQIAHAWDLQRLLDVDRERRLVLELDPHALAVATLGLDGDDPA